MPFALTHLSGFGGGSPIFVPTDVTTATLRAWYKSSNIVGTTVTAWNDQSSNGLNALASNLPGNDGGTKISGPENQDAVRFNGTSEGLQSASFVAVSQAYHIFVVLRTTTWTSQDALLVLNNANTSVMKQDIATPKIIHGAPTNANDVDASLNTWYLLESLFNGASSLQRLNDDAAVSTGNPGSNTMDELTIASASGGGQFGNFDIADISIYDAEVTGDDLTNLRNNYYRRVFGLW